ncbi:MAG: peptidoglycan-binding protein [Rhodoplanes sp.]|uniref:peptidoglycan-binding domain-containing protein n=1 Tax=Rhodoplanes sp. TaxID=1968906 RepID=UPI001838A542|nr:peptidoglycan-binding domain-containing protein [Rhodoplanes sp.]NVO16049.1 peptidoglycan-binding protein [Rhodoplanes sp.]
MRDPVDEDVDLRDETAGAVRARRRGAVTVVALALLRRPRDTLASAAGIAAFATIVINALFMQPGPHPAPIFALRTERPPVVVAGRESTGALSVLPRPRPPDAPLATRPDLQATAPAGAAPKPAAPRPLVTDIQRELLRRGYYDGPVDGVAGSRTETAIRDFEQATGLAPTGEPTDTILKSIARAPVKAKPGTPPRRDPIAGLLGGSSAPAPHPPLPVVQAKATVPPAPLTGSAPASMPPLPVVQAKATAAPPSPPAPVPTPSTGSSQVKSVQRALADYGYGQVRPTGVYDKTTHDAIAAFEEARRMPVTGQVSDRLVRELVALTGRPIE